MPVVRPTSCPLRSRCGVWLRCCLPRPFSRFVPDCQRFGHKTTRCPSAGYSRLDISPCHLLSTRRLPPRSSFVRRSDRALGETVLLRPVDRPSAGGFGPQSGEGVAWSPNARAATGSPMLHQSSPAASASGTQFWSDWLLSRAECLLPTRLKSASSCRRRVETKSSQT